MTVHRDDQHFVDRVAQATRVIHPFPIQVVTDGLAAELGYSDAAVTEVDAAAATTTLLPVNASRRRVFIFNDSSSNLRIKFGTGAGTDDFSFFLSAQGVLELDPPTFIGEITGIWESAVGSARITELSVS